MKRPTKQRLVALAFTVLAVILAVKFIAAPSIVWEDSMEPTLKRWDFCLLLRSRHYEPQRGDIVVFRTVDEPVMLFVKRVVAIPGDTLAIEHGQVSINGNALAEPYTSTKSDWSLAATNVPPGKIYVIGDNRALPMDEVMHGFVATRLVTGRVTWHGRWHP